MAIDPTISLAVRPVQMPLPNIQSPVDRLAQVLSLRNLMTQGQLGQIGLQSKQLEYEQLQQAAQERANLAKLYGQGTAAPPTVTGAPTAPPASIPVQTAPIQTPQVGPTGGTQNVRGLPNVGALPSPPPGAPLGGLMTQPAAPAPTAPAVAPALAAATIQDPFADMPSYSDILRAAPTTGFAHVETIAKAKKAYYDSLEEQHKAQLNQINDVATLASTVHDEPTKFSAIAEAFSRKLITPEVRDQLMSHPYNKAEWDGFQTQTLEGKARLQEARDQINQKAKEAQDAFEATKRPFELTEAQGKATEATAKAKTATYGSVAQDAALPTDQASWDTFLAGVPEALRSKLPATYSAAGQQLTVKKLGQTPEQQITTTETEKQHALQNVFEAVRTKIEGQKNAREENIYQQTYGENANQSLVGVDPKLRTQVTKEAQKIGDEFAKAQASADQFQALLDLAKAGNKAAGSNLPLVGVETLNAINGIKRINKEEIKQYGSAGSLYDKIAGEIGGLTVGQPIPADVLKDIETMHNTLRQGSEAEFKSRRQGLNDVYKSNFPTDAPRGRAGSVTPEVRNALSNQAPGIHQLGDGSVWLKNADGSIQPTTAPKQ